MKKENTIISFVIDKNPRYYYMGDLLIYSLLRNTSVKKENIIVQCINGVSTHFYEYLEKIGIKYTIISPLLDKRNCNKIRQLEYFYDRDENVLLLDTDIFLLNDIEIKDPECYNGKTVDGPFPTLENTKDIFERIGMELPKTISSDWDMIGGNTIETNFNTGVCYVPNKYVKKLHQAWVKHATYLFQNQHLFVPSENSFLAEQFGMCIALTETKIPISHLDANDNCGSHINHKHRLMNNSREISAIHYHPGTLNYFGLIETKHIESEKLLRALDLANQQILNYQSLFLEGHKKSFRSKPTKNDKTIAFKAIVDTIDVKKNIIIHAGTPKCGTTSLQHFLYNNRPLLSKYNFSYPEKIWFPSQQPKHQWMVEDLLKEDVISFAENLRFAIENSKEDNVILSTEGIFNHWFDYSSTVKECFSILKNKFPIKLVVYFREPYAFLESFYKQSIRNFPFPENHHRNFCTYGTGDSFNEMMDKEWFQKHLDYAGFILDVNEIFGEENVKCIVFNGDTVNQFLDYLKIPEKIKISEKRENIGLSNMEILGLRRINGLKIKRGKYLLRKINSRISPLIVGKFGDTKPNKLDDKFIHLIENEKATLSEKFNIHFK